MHKKQARAGKLNNLFWIFKNIFSSLIFPFLIKFKIKNFAVFEERIYSQNGEDGIIKAIFKKMGTTQ